ncbi:hypothetical protein AQ490_15270 [Wenjunlia vitaminophila]|uniref:Uncharacterized protein n=1 Tax=Wenjunlia vitaminophila TaxID=76728 RepID=A0A0T6LWL3_WENVI|nr:hypothetical protein [Wenjunlia vitaminophila]KRV50445.1 hypothetical protein AQ490_15270 [Wenjunlia vitaminophila]
MSTSFEDRLVEELKREARVTAAGWPEPERRRVFTPTRTVTGLVTAAAAVGAFVALPGGGAGTPAYAVEKTDNGGVVVHISDWPHGDDEVAEFTRMLRDAGVSTVYNPPEGYLCQPLPDGVAERSPSGPKGVHTEFHRSFVGGATVIGPEVAQVTGPGAPAAGLDKNTSGSPEKGTSQGEGDKGTTEKGTSQGEGDKGTTEKGTSQGEGDKGTTEKGTSQGEGDKGTRTTAGSDEGASRQSNGDRSTDQEFTYHLKEGDTAILSDSRTMDSIAFVKGACAPVAKAAK